ncbi:Lipase (class 3) [Ceratobasidium sp. AG-Ba]|nr:Lipase (class 3) [Ceratobasidium sp. AG-Ba]QRV98578.1 Lipase (class 3) [Ceratobasidium sp. AG-Ba]
MVGLALRFFAGISLSVLVFGSPIQRAGVTTLSTTEIGAYGIYAKFARAAYCPAATTATWTCGEACRNITDFTPYASGGDGAAVPYWYVGYHAGTKSVVVGNQGTDGTKFLAILIDANFSLKSLNSTKFPGVPSSVQGHSGFVIAQEMAAEAKLSAIKSTMTKTGTNSVIFTGHSLGGAVSLLDSLYVLLNIPSAKIKVVTHGMPRVGNKAFADLIDSKVSDLTHINNKKDIVPTLPPRLIGYAHPSGEKHILAPGSWVACAGQDNTDTSCIVGAVPTLFNGNANDHVGPYEGTYVGKGYERMEPPRVPSAQTSLSSPCARRPVLDRDRYAPLAILSCNSRMLDIASYIAPVIAEFGTMVAAPIIAAAFLVAVGGGALDNTIINVEDSFLRWWRDIVHRKRPLLITADGDNSTRHHELPVSTRSPSPASSAVEQVELSPRKERRKTMAEEAAANFGSKPASSRSPPRVIGTRRRRSRGNSQVDVEMNAF